MISRSLRSFLLFLFFLSGFAALLYQVVWQRMLVFYTGSDTVSISLIVTAFMSGLGLGYAAGGKLADSRRPQVNLVLFVLAELGILLFAAFSKEILYDLLYLNGPKADGNPLILYTMVFSVLLIPTFLMGMSLPLLSRAFRMGAMSEQAGYISSLYFVNTLGASFGALITGLFLVRTMGYEDALWVGVVMNGICVIGAFSLSARVRKDGSADATLAMVSSVPLKVTPGLIAWSMQYGLSGFAALSLELIWFRVLGTLIKSVSVTFSILLAIYLGSMAVGTEVGRRWVIGRSVATKERVFLWSQFVLYTSVGLSFLLLVSAVFRVDSLTFLWDYFKSYEPDLYISIVAPTYVLIPLFLMLIPTFLMGVSFSVSQSLIQDKFDEVGRKVGLLQFVNILGSALGAWAVTWIGFTLMGSAVMIKVITAIGVLYLAVLVWRKHIGILPAAIGAGVLLTVVILLPDNASFWRRLNGIRDPAHFLYNENESGLSVIKRMDRKGEFVGVVFANGLGQSIMPYNKDPIHTELGLIPVLLHPKPESVAVIGLGSGGTVYGTAARPETKNVVCFEIMNNQAGVLETYASDVGDASILDLLSDPRLKLILHDGRYRLTMMPDKYDVIEADALRPNSAYSGNIYSKQYFELLRDRLKPGGIAVSWCPTQRVFTTMQEAFPYVMSVNGFIGIGSNEPFNVDWEAVMERANDPFTKAHLNKAGIDVNTILTPYQGTFVVLKKRPVHRSEINTDLFPRDEFLIPYTWANFREKYGI